MSLINTNLLIIIYAIFFNSFKIGYSQNTISLSNFQINFENKGEFTDFTLISSLSGQLENVWMGIAFGPYTYMVKIFKFNSKKLKMLYELHIQKIIDF